ncbi:hypothetical protein DENIS_1397 [Desulfonema ishimotonii]|uniref:DUF4292 domain-containing protein n=1 Tax=Desulfonema ishimotonii TaxID=45657 RepID=A0A401FU15_9BACT|nr:DUF4292 domain-containing protein [Desulfonema ishimotonii]GBC60444.1 hypothetical protein DENIS_1397 [Desulfonema ishimotonii]
MNRKDVLTGLRFYEMLLAVVILCLFSACAGLTPEVPSPVISDEARQMLSMLHTRNLKLMTFKGIGKATLWEADRRQIIRLAWIGAVPEKLRVSLLNVSGQSVGGFSADGEHFYAVSHTEKRLYRVSNSNPELKKIIRIPIRTRTLIQLLTGRIPVAAHTVAAVIPAQVGEGRILVLKSRRGRILEQIYLNRDMTTVSKLELFDADGDFKFRVRFDRMTSVKNYRIPFKISVSNEDTRFQLLIDRYWTDMPISPDAFVLTDPEK